MYRRSPGRIGYGKCYRSPGRIESGRFGRSLGRIGSGMYCMSGKLPERTAFDRYGKYDKCSGYIVFDRYCRYYMCPDYIASGTCRMCSTWFHNCLRKSLPGK